MTPAAAPAGRPGEPFSTRTGLAVNGQTGLINIQDQSYLVVRGFEIRNYSTSSTANVPIGIYITGADSYIQILNNHIHNIKTSASGCNANALGIAVYGDNGSSSINNLTISGNELDHMTTGCSETMSLDGNVQYWTVSDNLIHDNNNIGIDAIGFEGVSPNPSTDQARDGLIVGNTVYNITSYGNPAYGNQYAADGIYVDGGTRITIERNVVHNTDLNVELASEHSGKVTSYVTMRNNLIYQSNSVGVSIGGYDSRVGGTDHCTIVNNTLWDNDTKNTGSGEFQIQYYATNKLQLVLLVRGAIVGPVDLEWGDLRWILVVSIRHRQGRALPLRRSSVLRPLIHAAEVGRSVDFAGCECGHQSGFVPCRHRGLRRQAACQREWPNQYWRLRTVTATSGRSGRPRTGSDCPLFLMLAFARMTSADVVVSK